MTYQTMICRTGELDALNPVCLLVLETFHSFQEEGPWTGVNTLVTFNTWQE